MSKAFAVVSAIVVLLWTMLWLAFRGDVVEVFPAQVGRIKTPSGFQEDLRGTGVFRLPSNWFGQNPTKLVVVDVSDNPIDEPIELLFMPQDRLNLSFEVLGTLAVKADNQSKDAIYDRISPESNTKSPTARISFQQVYKTYGSQVVRTVAQEVVAGHTIEYVFNNLEQVSDEIQKRVSARLVKTPLMCKHIGLGKVKPPDLIIAAQESAKKRQIEEDTAKAEKDVQLTLADGRLNVELLEQEIHLVEAETQVMSDLILSDSVSEAFIAQRALRAWQGLVNNPNATFVIPMRVFRDPKTLIGLSDEAVHRFDIDAETKAHLDAVLKDIEAIKATEREKMQKSSEESKKSDK